MSKPKPKDKQEDHKPKKNYTKFLVCAAILLATYITFLPALDAEFTNWDDPKYILDNHIIKDLSWERTKAIFLDEERKSGLYAPLTYLSWAWEFDKVRLEPRQYHFDNVLLHLMNTALVFWLIFLIAGKRIEVAAITAALFGLHPMHVESVAWITERKDVLFTVFFLASMISYMYYCLKEKGKTKFFILSIILFLLSLLSKPAAVTLPIALLLVDYFSGRLIKPIEPGEERLSLIKRLFADKAVLLEKIPFFAISLLWGYITINTTKSIAAEESFSLLERTLFAFYGLTNYSYKLLVPLELSNFYPYPRLVGDRLPMIYYISPFIVMALTYLVYRSAAYTRTLVFGALFFFFSIALVLQFFPVGPNIVTDRYTYVPYIGLFFIIGQGYAYLQDQKTGKLAALKMPVLLLLVAFIGYCSYLSTERCKVWKNSETLWTDVIAKFPNTSEGYLNRGQYYTDTDQFDKALADYEVTLRLNPKSTLAYINRGNVFGRQGVFDLALENYSQAIKLTPTASKIYLNRGNVYGMQGLIDSSIADYTKAISLERNYLDAYINRAISYSKKRDFNNAFADFDMALRINPNSLKTYNMRAYAHLDFGNYDKSIADYNILIGANPKDANSYFYRALAYQRKEGFQSAINDYGMTINLNPGNASAFLNRSLCYESVKNFKAALQDALTAKKAGQAVGDDYIERLRNLAEGK